MASQQNPLDHDRPPGGGELSAHVPDADDGTDGRPGGGANSGPAAGQQPAEVGALGRRQPYLGDLLRIVSLLGARDTTHK